MKKDTIKKPVERPTFHHNCDMYRVHSERNNCVRCHRIDIWFDLLHRSLECTLNAFAGEVFRAKAEHDIAEQHHEEVQDLCAILDYTARYLERSVEIADTRILDDDILLDN